MIHMGEGIKGGGVAAGDEDEKMGGAGIMHQCIDHPHKNNPGGGICAFCLQDKLGKLASSSFPLNSSSSPPSSPSNTTTTAPAATSQPALASLSLSAVPPKNNNGSLSDHHNHDQYSTRSRLPFLMPKNKEKTKALNAKRNGFWSFLYPSSKPSPPPPCPSSSSTKKLDAKSINGDSNGTPRISSASTSAASGSVKPREQNCNIIGSYYNSQSNSASGSCFDHQQSKVSRSRSVGCSGSRSFSGDFFDRISTGFGDCSTLRRVESQREGGKRDQCMVKGRGVSCGGIFGGFMVMNNASSYSNSSSYWGSWVFASPVRAFSSKASSSSSSKDNKNNDATPNLSAIPSLLTVTG